MGPGCSGLPPKGGAPSWGSAGTEGTPKAFCWAMAGAETISDIIIMADRRPAAAMLKRQRRRPCSVIFRTEAAAFGAITFEATIDHHYSFAEPKDALPER